MEDSPLSLTASIAGILTFISAIFGFIYIRYTILRNSSTEMSTILESVVATIEETQQLAQTGTNGEPGQNAQPSLQEKLIVDLYRTEYFIISKYLKVYLRGDDLFRQMHSQLQSAGSAGLAWQDAMHAAEVFPTPDPPRRRRISRFYRNLSKYLEILARAVPSLPEPVFGIWAIINFVVTFGQTPELVRWYIVRDEVLGKIKKREDIRSRLLSQQVSTANLHAQSLLDEMKDIRSEIKGIRSEISELKHQVAQETR